MSTANLNNEQVKEKIAQALQYSGMIKDTVLARSHTSGVIIDNYINKIRNAMARNDDYTPLIKELIFELEFQIESVLESSIRLAAQREDADIDILLYTLPLYMPKCGLDYYRTTIQRYEAILIEELQYAKENGIVNDLATFLSNPQGYISSKKNGLQTLKESVTSVQRGVSYSIYDNIKKLIASGAALSFTNAKMYLWEKSGTVIGYMGVRGSNFPCALCDSYAYVFIPMSSGMIYPLHNRCVCAIVPLTRNEIL